MTAFALPERLLRVTGAALSSLAVPRFCLFGRRPGAFHVCGVAGLALGVALGVLLTTLSGLSLVVLAAVVVTAVATFLVLAMLTRMVRGEEQLVYYHHEIAILATVSGMLLLAGEPVLPYLDVAILGVGAFLCLGRIGCFMVGCCHGRPCRWGVSYRQEHAEEGFTPYYVGVRLVPVQLVESVWVLATVVVGVLVALGDGPPGSALAWYVIVYDVGRFGIEFLRGDPGRPHRGGFSEGQWTSLLLMAVVVALELAGVVPLQTWHVVATGVVVAVMVLVGARRRVEGDLRYRLRNPDHVRELARALELVSVARPAAAGAIAVATTSAGLRISADRTECPHGPLCHYTISAVDGPLDEPTARVVADSITVLGRRRPPGELVPGGAGVFHLLLPSAVHRERAGVPPR